MARWLLKSEPSSYGWADLVRDGGTRWDGVRNPAAAAHLRAMAPGDEALIYHTGAEKAAVGIARVTGPPEPDGDEGRWTAVPLAPASALPRPDTRARLTGAARLAALPIIRQSRLSVCPVGPAEWAAILELAGA